MHNSDELPPTITGDEARWFALFAKPRSEHKVAAALLAKGIVAYVPSLIYHGKRGNMLAKPFFPRYLFARFDWQNARSAVQWTPGVAQLVIFDDRPAWLSDDQVALIKQRLTEIDGDSWLRLKPGERVRVTAGPFRGLEAVFDRHLNGEVRVAILLQILGRQTLVKLPVGEVRRIAD